MKAKPNKAMSRNAADKERPKGLASVPLGCSIPALVGAPVVMLLFFGGTFWAKGKGALAPNPITGQIYEVCIGGKYGGCTPHYLTHAQYITFQATQAPTWIIIAFSVGFTAFAIVLGLWRKYRSK